MSLHIHISNRVEALAGTLADGIKNSGSFFRAADPLRKTRIVVQSRGVEIWLKQFFAGHGIPVVNFDFPFMQNAVKDILKINFGSSEVEKVFRTYSENAMMWSVERILRENKNSGFPEFNENEHIADVKRFQLASCIASEFDRLLTYRADILSAWENGGNSGVAPALKWLPELWRRLVEELGPKRVKGAYPRLWPSNMLFGYSTRFGLLSEAGYSARVLDEVKSCFLPMAEKTGTLWESVSTEGFSCCHGFPCQAAWLLVRDALGVTRIDRRAKTVHVSAPKGISLEWCEATLPVSKDDSLTVKWRRGSGGLPVYESVLPQGWTGVYPFFEREGAFHPDK